MSDRVRFGELPRAPLSAAGSAHVADFPSRFVLQMPALDPQSSVPDSESGISRLAVRASGSRRPFLSVFAVGLVLLAFASFSTGLMGDYCYDDVPTIRDNKALERWSAMRALATRDFGPTFGELSYRPIAPATYFVDAIVFRKEPFFSRLLNLALHVAVGLSLFGLWRRVFGREDLAFLAAALFLVHPIVTETVNCPGFREDLLAMLFAVWAIRALARGIAKVSTAWIAVSAVAWFLALLSKEPAAMALLLAPLVLGQSRETREAFGAARPRATFRTWVFPVALFGAVLFVYATLYLSLSPHGPPAEWPGGGGRLLGFLNFCRALLLYLRLWAFPAGLSINHGFVASTAFGDARLWAGLGVLAALAILSAQLYVRQNPAAGTGGLWVCIALVPLFQIVPTPQPVAERYLYMPHAGMALLVAALVLGSRGGISRRPAESSAPRPGFASTRVLRLTVVVVLVVACAALTFRRNLDWIDDATLNIRAYEMWDNAEGRGALGALYLSQGKLDRAAACLREALALDPALAPAHRALGILLLKEGRGAEGRVHIEKAFELDPADPLNRAAVERLRARKEADEDAPRELERK